MKSDKPIIVSMGEPSGISSEIIIKAWLKRFDDEPIWPSSSEIPPEFVASNNTYTCKNNGNDDSQYVCNLLWF